MSQALPLAGVSRLLKIYSNGLDDLLSGGGLDASAIFDGKYKLMWHQKPRPFKNLRNSCYLNAGHSF